ncbi:MAG TPA: iron-sulfur cluster insertion protein ErpA [Actinomycetota bacterium]
MEATTTTTAPLALTDSAAVKVKELLSREQTETPLALRVAVQPGGCSGLRYALYFDDELKDTDIVGEFGGVKLVVDKMSAPYLKGAKVDYVDTLERSGFTVDNPNAQSSCACGDSFN